jgi:hypothetical protein
MGLLSMHERVSGLEAQTHAWLQLAKRDRSFDASQTRHVDVEKCDVWTSLQSELDCLGTVFGLENHDLADGLAHGEGKLRTGDGVVVCDQELNSPVVFNRTDAAKRCDLCHCGLLFFAFRQGGCRGAGLAPMDS